MMMRKYEVEELEAIQKAKDFLNGYRLCVEMLNLRKYERRRLQNPLDTSGCADILAGDEAFWRARMYAVSALLGKMKNGREKLMLYYHYVKGESVERAAPLLGVSRRTAFRIHQKALLSASYLLNSMKKTM